MSDGVRTIIFNGEIYNYQSLTAEVTGPLTTTSDTEVVLALYRTYGPDCVKRLDGMFAFAILDGDNLFLARDPIGIKPLYYARRDGKIHFASEIKALEDFTDSVQEFPPGYYWHSKEGFKRYYRLADLKAVREPTSEWAKEEDIAEIRATIDAAVQKRMIADDGVPVGVSLSGGLDSSIIAALAKSTRGTLDTFAVGMPLGEDLPASRSVADYLGTRHHVLMYTFEDMLKALPEVIYYLESYDAALVRSAIPNYFLARLASNEVKVILTGEGADELFAGYEYLRDVRQPDLLQKELWTIMAGLHNTNLQRTDRMTMAHGIEGRVPFLDQSVVELAFRLPPAWKAPWHNRPEKELLRRAFADMLPDEIIERPKQKFSQGTGSGQLMADYANRKISDSDFAAERKKLNLRSKEELLYYRLFKDHYGDRIPDGVIGRTRSVMPAELN
jgi:asparagine synthase (glutamine-hydrolysing)